MRDDIQNQLLLLNPFAVRQAVCFYRTGKDSSAVAYCSAIPHSDLIVHLLQDPKESITWHPVVWT